MLIACTLRRIASATARVVGVVAAHLVGREPPDTGAIPLVDHIDPPHALAALLGTHDASPPLVILEDLHQRRIQRVARLVVAHPGQGAKVHPGRTTAPHPPPGKAMGGALSRR